MDLILGFVIAMIIAMALIPPLASAAGRLRILDDPDARKVHTQPIPRIGGVAMAIATLVPLCVWLPMSRPLLGYLIAVMVLVAFGALDDRFALRARSKLTGQIIAVLIVMWVGQVSIDSLMFAEPISIPSWVGMPLTFLFLLGITNAINLSDGLDGLAGGTALLCAAAIALLAQHWKVPFVETLAVLLMGALLGFLRFNTYPARIFMGDAGSQFLGFTLGVLCILLSRGAATPVSTSLPLLLVGLPLVDTLFVMFRRLRARQPLFRADKMHFHHRLLDMGFDHHEAVIVIYAVQCALLLVAWQLRFESDVLILTVFGTFTACFVLAVAGLEVADWRWRRSNLAKRSAITRFRTWLAASESLPRWSSGLASLCLGIYLLSVALTGDKASVDVAWLALICLGAIVVSLCVRRYPLVESWLYRAVLFVAVIAATYLDQISSAERHLLNRIDWLVLPPLAIAAAIAIRFARHRRFEATPLDLLLIFAALALPNLPGTSSAAGSIGISVAKLVVLCYAAELIAAARAPQRAAALLSAAAFNLVIAVRAFA